MSDITTLMMAAAGGGAEETDPNFNQTVLLLHGDGTNGAQNNTFVDSSTNNFTITRNGNVTQGSFSPFGRTSGNLDDVYDPAVNGGSGYFDGTGDNLTFTGTSSTVGSGDFTIECWYYPTAFQDYDTLFGNTRGATGFNFGTNASASVTWYSSSAAQITSGALQLNAWNHIAFTRTSNTLRLYVNGAQTGSTPTVSTNFSDTAYVIGDLAPLPSSEPANGYITGLRVVKESLASGSTYTIPTAPYQASDNANTSLLLNFTNASIFDNTGKNNLETVGNAQVDTSTKKYGTGSLEFDGTGDYLVGKSNDLLNMSTGDFTIEMWLYPNSVSGDIVLLDTRAAGGDSGYAFYINSTSKLGLYTSGADKVTASTSLSTGAWVHVALVRSGSTVAIYIGGSQDATATYSSAMTCPGRISIGSGFDNAAPYNGFIDDLRITKGVARSTTVPTKAYPDL